MPNNIQPDIDEVLARLSAVEQQAERLATELAHAQRLAAVGTIAAGVAHEINNILTPVLSYAAYAQSNPDDHAMAQKAIEKAVSGAAHAADITRALLNFSAADRSDADIADVADVVDQSFACLARDPARDGIEVRVDIGPGLAVQMPPQRLQQVLLNLLLNATTAMRRGHTSAMASDGEGVQGRGGTDDRLLTVSARHASGEHIAIRVADTGPGLPPGIRSRLFEPFVTDSKYQVGESDTEDRSQREGCGLGLSICKTLVEQAGGTIEAETVEGEGTTFTVTLDAAREVRRKSA